METPYIRRLGQGRFHRPTLVFTSTQYPVVQEPERLGSSFGGVQGKFIPAYSSPLQEQMSSLFSSVEGDLVQTLFPPVVYDNWPPEGVESSFIEVGGELRAILRSYDNYEAEAMDSSFEAVSGTLEQVLIQYNNYDTESLNASFESVSGDLT